MTTPTPSQPSPDAAGPTPKERLMSVDALRGFDMFWIIGADSLVYALNRMTDNRATGFLKTQLEHVQWEGIRFYDLIFPLFVFIVGVSLVFSLTSAIQKAGRTEAVKRVIRRSILLFALGIFYSGGLSGAWPDVRLMGVLNRIAIAYLVAGLFFCYFKPRTLIALCAGLLLGYWALLSFAPIRDIQLTKRSLAAAAIERGDTEAAALIRRSGNPSSSTNREPWLAAEAIFYSTTNYIQGKDAVRTNMVVTQTEAGSTTNVVVSKYPMGLNFTDHFDFKYLPGRKYDQYFDPEGFLSNVPAIATCLLGVFAGLLLRSNNYCGKSNVIYLLSAGVAAAALGWLWGLHFPVIKKIWTSSYVLVAGGYSAILLAMFYAIVDLWKWQAWSKPFVWLGMNAITIYLFSGVISGFSRRFVGGDIRNFFNEHLARGAGDLLISLAGLFLCFWFVHFLYKRKIFLRV
jgi:predicted acyltransferase